MISIPIMDIKNFMLHLLSRETFDRFYAVEASVKKNISYHIDGHLHHDFFDTEDGHDKAQQYCFWKEIRPHMFNIIRGKRIPLGCKIVLALPEASVRFLLAQSQGSFREEDIEGVYLNVLYDPESLTLTTGVSYRTFSLDKTFEHNVDDHLQKFLKDRGIC